MKPHFRITRGETRWYHCVVMPWPSYKQDDQNAYHCALMVHSFGEAVRLLSAMAAKKPPFDKENN